MRPLLEFWRAETLAYCAERGLDERLEAGPAQPVHDERRDAVRHAAAKRGEKACEIRACVLHAPCRADSSPAIAASTALSMNVYSL